ncbi:SGNH/GDSL hydrolase family protein [Streptomyces sp.]|uniref:SGNH/GDSL hydrolase family protein n=1 Tax=Streptomyces sp. TaxID=1931 RepID=UPI0028122298|nr:SGNH/GDSL hydrolase family protein [Streptomyces sp.]
MTTHQTFRRVTAALVTLVTTVALTACGSEERGTVPPGAPASEPAFWRGAWAASPQAPGTSAENWSAEGFSDHTLRQSVRVTLGGERLRIELSNRYGTRPLRIDGATVARAAGKGAVVPGSARPLTFDGGGTVTIPAGGTLLSDAADLPLDAFDSVTVTLRLSGATGPATVHRVASATTHRAKGDHLSDIDGSAFTETDASWYFLTGVEIQGSSPDSRAEGAVVTFGDSLTDGTRSTRDANHRYPDALAERLAATGRPRAVLNHGISGNKVVRDGGPYGEKALTRFGPDALTERGVTTVIILEGTNDLGYTSDPEVSVDELIEGHLALIGKARARGLRVVGATLPPFKGSSHYSPHNEAQRDAFNDWIRTSGAYDAYADLDRALADPGDPDRIRPAYDSGDRLHPNDAGYRAMAEAVDLDVL